jgi:hypothetical protein
MPTIAIVDGLKIRIFYNDHTPPRFHAILGEDELLVTIRDLDVLQGSLPPARLRRELAWAAKHQSELALNQMSGQSGAGTDLNVPKVLDNIITASEPDPNTFEVTVTWATGDKTIHRFGHLAGKGVFAALANPAVFRQVMVGERGRSLEWPGEIDFCADALWLEAHPAEAPRQAQHADS